MENGEKWDEIVKKERSSEILSALLLQYQYFKKVERIFDF
jgi:hypothetical protein